MGQFNADTLKKAVDICKDFQTFLEARIQSNNPTLQLEFKNEAGELVVPKEQILRLIRNQSELFQLIIGRAANALEITKADDLDAKEKFAVVDFTAWITDEAFHAPSGGATGNVPMVFPSRWDGKEKIEKDGHSTFAATKVATREVAKTISAGTFFCP